MCSFAKQIVFKIYCYMKHKILILFFMSAIIFGSCQNNRKSKVSDESGQPAVPEAQTPALAFDPATLPEEPVFELKTSEGTMVIKLYKDTPQHRDNFVKLASERYYDNILFHRVIKGFMIQCGDPESRGAEPNKRLGSGGPGYTVPAEFVATLKHKKGAIAAARTGDSVNPQKASSGSQFYIVQNEETCSQLDGSYTVFGEVIQGIEVIDKIAATTTGAADRPVKDIRIISLLPVQTE